MNGKKILVVEDDPFIADELSKVIGNSFNQCVGVCNNALQAIDDIKQHSPDLILMDINLNNAMDGIELSHIVYSHFKIKALFISGYDDEETKKRVSFTHNYGFISKPFTEEDIILGINLAFSENKLPHKEIDLYQQKRFYFIKTTEGLEKVFFNDIVFIEAYDYYCFLYLTYRKVLVCKSMRKLEQELDNPFLVKIHRSYIVNLYHIQRILGRQLEINGRVLPLSKNYKKDLLFELNKM